MFSFSLNSIFTTNDFSVICESTKSDFGFCFNFFRLFSNILTGSVEVVSAQSTYIT